MSMARKRTCFAASVCCSDSFADLGAEAQALYYRLGFEADSDGAIGNVRQVVRMTGFDVGVVAELVAAGLLIEVQNVHVVTHWWVNNTKNTRDYRPGDHREAVDSLALDDNRVYRLVTGDTLDIQWETLGHPMENPCQYNIKESNGKESKGIQSNPIEANPKEENPSENAPARESARCPQCGAECAAVNEFGTVRGWCPNCDLDFTA